MGPHAYLAAFLSRLSPVLILAVCATAAFAQAPKPLQLEVSTPTQPAVQFDAQGNALPATLGDTPSAAKLEAVEGRPMPYQTIRRDRPWWYGPEIPLGPGRAWPTSWPSYGSPYGPAWPGPSIGPWGGWGGWGGYGPYW